MVPSLISIPIAALLLMLCLSCGGQKNQPQSSNTEPKAVTATLKSVNIPNTPLILEDTLDPSNINQIEDIQKTYYENGQLKQKGKYDFGKKEGLHKEWFSNGHLSTAGYYVNGKANGLMKWYHEKGHLAAEGNMKDGNRDGPWLIRDIHDAAFYIEAYFEAESREGLWKIYDGPTNLIKEQLWKDDKLVNERCLDKVGKEITCE